MHVTPLLGEQGGYRSTIEKARVGAYKGWWVRTYGPDDQLRRETFTEGTHRDAVEVAVRQRMDVADQAARRGA